MAETNFFWQGGRKVAVAKDASAITIEASSEAAAEAAAARASVDLQGVRPATPGLMRGSVSPAAREDAVDRLRAQHNVVHHVYRNAAEPEAGEYLITESFFLKFKTGTPESRINDYLARESLIVERQIDPTTLLVRVSDATGKNPIRAANAAAEESDVEYAEPNLVRPLTRFFIPPD
jgi:hypothetical protein